MNRIVDILEKHAEKIVLGIVGFVCLLLLTFRVIISPNVVEYGGKRFSPRAIDNYINEQAELLEGKLEQEPRQPKPYKPQVPDYSARVASAISNIDVSFCPPIPPPIARDVRKDEIAYRIPLIGEVSDVAVEHIRAVAYVPTGEITEQNVYDKAQTEANDVDFVTVEGKFGVAGLYERFYESFAGEGVQEEWRDPCLAKPVFAAVQLQRQELDDDGSWSDWQAVPRTRIDYRRKMFEVIEDTKELPPGGIKVQMLQFDNPQVRIDMLQPMAYQIASANEEWFPPSLHKKFLEQRKEAEMEAKRKAIEQAREQREKEREERLNERRSARRDTRTRSGRSGGQSGEYGMGGLLGGSRSESRTGTRRSRSDRGRYPGSATDTRRTRGDRERPVRRETRDERRGTRSEEELSAMGSGEASGVYDEFHAILITPETDIARMLEPLVFWAHDDTIELKKSYRYRIRLGVFNPIAGLNRFSQPARRKAGKLDEMHKNEAILWSEFSDVTEPVEIIGRSYFFANDIREAAKTVTVTVYKYVLGYWYSEKFPVARGEVIGKVKPVELKPQEKQTDIIVPQTIDYGTGAVFVDVMPVNDWSGSRKLVARDYYDMLYSFDGMNMEHMPIKARYWSKELQAAFSELQNLERQPKQPLRNWDTRVTQRFAE